MFENPRRGRQARNFTTNVSKILDLKSSSEQIFFRKLSLGAPENINHSSENLKVIYIKCSLFFAIINYHFKTSGLYCIVLLKNIGLSLNLFNNIIICPHLILSGANPDRFLTFKENKTFGVKTPEFLGEHNADLSRLCLRVQQTATHSTAVKSPLEFSASAFKFRNRKNKPSSSK